MGLLPLSDFYHMDCYGLQLLNRDREVTPTGAYPSRAGYSMEPLPLSDFYRLR